MRWRFKPDPTVGDERVVRRFLILPRTIGGERRWLEMATFRECCTGWSYLESYWTGRSMPIWEGVAWIDSSEPRREG